MSMRTVPELLACSFGITCFGSHRCFYCGASCDETYLSSEYVKGSFNGRGEVIAPGSPAVCAGCVLCLRESCDLIQITGEPRNVRVAAMRAFSWLVTADQSRAGSKAHLAELRAVALNPPPVPWALVLSDSGQKHLLYRGVVNHDGPPWVVTLEGERVSYSPSELSCRMILCGQLIAATGKPALAEPVTIRLASSVIGRYRDGELLVENWNRVRTEPLSRLAAWLSPKKELCEHEYPGDIVAESKPIGRTIPIVTPDPGHGSVPPQTRGPGRSGSGGRHDREARRPRDRQSLLFDSE